MAESMGLAPEVPDGWRMLGDNEQARKGDACAVPGHPWKLVDWDCGTCGAYPLYKFIRKIENYQPAPEKNWLNPWD